MQNYIIHDGDFFAADAAVISPSNRSFLYGDGLFESIFAQGGVAPFLTMHIERLQRSMKVLTMEDPEKVIRTNNIDYQIGRLLRKNRSFKGSRLRLIIFRKDGGLYTPATNEISYILTSENLPNSYFELNKKGFTVDIYTKTQKQANYLSSIKSTNALLYVMAGNFKKHKNIDDCLLLNQHNYLCEGMSSNLFLFKHDVLYTPPLEDGCVNGIMRAVVIDVAKCSGLKVADKVSIDPAFLSQADECFLTNAVSGIRWIVAYRNKRYYNKIATFLLQKMNERAFPNV